MVGGLSSHAAQKRDLCLSDHGGDCSARVKPAQLLARANLAEMCHSLKPDHALFFDVRGRKACGKGASSSSLVVLLRGLHEGLTESDNGSDNGAALFTKALDHDSIVGHIETMGCDFMFRRVPIAFMVNSLSAKVNVEKLALELENRFKTSGRMRVDTTGLAQQNLQDHEQGRGDLERCCIQSDCRREEWRHPQYRRR